MKKMQMILIFCISLTMLTGCWDRKEINDIALVEGVGIDQIDKDIELSAQILIPKAMGGGQGGGGGNGGTVTMVRSGRGENITDALSKLQERLPREVFWGHTKVIVIGEKLAKSGIREHLDFFARHPQTRMRSYVFVSKGNARDVLELSPPLERSSSEVIRELATSQILMRVTLVDLLLMLVGDSGDAALPMIDILPPKKGQKEQQTISYINRTALFKNDKMIGDIGDHVTRGVLWLRDEIKYANLTVKPEESNGSISVRLLRSNTQLIPKIEKGEWKMTVKTVADDDIIQNSSSLNLMNPKFVKIIKKELENNLNDQIQLAIEQVQKEKKIDIFGFGEVFHRKYPDEWCRVKNHWDEIFPTVEVTVNSRVNVSKPGKSTRPQGLSDREVKVE